MYRASTASQIRFDDFNQGCGMQLDKNNEWIRRGDLIPWQELEHLYSVYFPSKSGRPAHPFREALGSLIIQQRLTLSDRKTAKAIAEGPYLQYFIGLPRFQNEAPFQPTLLVEFRKRLTPEIMEQCNEIIIQALEEAEQKAKEAAPKKRGRKPAEETPDENGNLGTAILYATCAPSYIRYPQDFSLLNEAREKLEKIIHRFHEDYGLDLPRTRCRKARAVYLNLAKSKRRSAKKIRSVIRFMLNCIKRDNGYLENFMHEGYAPLSSEIRLLMTIQTLYDQQLEMYQKKTHRVNDRIVSITQPYIRPIVRGKAKAPVEFGTKFDLSLDEYGMGRIEKISFDPYNEGRTLENACERYRERTGHYPERVLVDQIYRNRENRRYCKEHGIRMSGPKLGRPGPQELTRDERRIENADNVDRIEVERAFSLSKRCYGLGLIRTKTEITTYSTISLSILTTNLFRILARTGRFIFAFFKYLFQLENFQLEGTTYLKYAC